MVSWLKLSRAYTMRLSKVAKSGDVVTTGMSVVVEVDVCVSNECELDATRRQRWERMVG
jgi:hypothetical protein